jgi:hypothetical protein
VGGKAVIFDDQFMVEEMPDWLTSNCMMTQQNSVWGDYNEYTIAVLNIHDKLVD